MIDLYKRLRMDDQAAEPALRDAIAARAADDPARAAAEFILLDPRRRAVYDKNRRLLTTIGRLRSRLLLNTKPFWTRGDFRDFTVTQAPPVPRGWLRRAPAAAPRSAQESASPPEPARAIPTRAPSDDLIAAALAAGHRHRRSRRTQRWARRAAIVLGAAMLLAVVALCVIAMRGGH